MGSNQNQVTCSQSDSHATLQEAKDCWLHAGPKTQAREFVGSSDRNENIISNLHKAPSCSGNLRRTNGRYGKMKTLRLIDFLINTCFEKGQDLLMYSQNGRSTDRKSFKNR